ncbi:hypothetical protein FH972_022051 [Carpinus fangiana]|uniref:Fatty acid hydroxylase domain-containing protein n=1 Tax=Carpinus fangiana TaxID=176857 RepID=A0A5N6KR44_9ROSI|nr:hypothetical protein FH972_022051 [Carpinus fangiana]
MLGFLPSINTLLSLPVVSLFFAPSLFSTSSISTSLNLLFFYLTWNTLRFAYPPLIVELFSSLAAKLIFYLLPSALFLAFDAGLPSVAKSIKAEGLRATPQYAFTRSHGRNHRVNTSKLVAWATFNTLLGVALQVGIDALFTKVLGLRSRLRVSSTIPMPWSLVKDVTRAFLLRDVLAYYVHRFLLHSSASPQAQRLPGVDQLTAWHAAWAHGLRTPVPFSATYDHPVNYLLHTWLPAYLPAFVFRMHMLNYLVFTSLLSLEQALVYSGYTTLPSTILLAGAARRQEAHLASGGEGNFGPWGFLDWMHGTSLGGGSDIMDDLVEEVDKRDIGGKVKKGSNKVAGKLDSRGWGSAGDKVRGGGEKAKEAQGSVDAAAQNDGEDGAEIEDVEAREGSGAALGNRVKAGLSRRMGRSKS